MIKNYIFDFGNVLCEFYPDRLSAPYVENPHDLKEISEVVFDRLYWDRLDDGTITDEEVKKEIRSRLSGKKGEIGCKIYDNWVFNLTPVSGMESLIEDLDRKGCKLYLISNISIGFAENYYKVPWMKNLLSKFDGLVFSGILGKTKPGKEIFEYLLGKYSLKSDECIFIDDSQKNLDGAKAVGIKGCLFDGDANSLNDQHLRWF